MWKERAKRVGFKVLDNKEVKDMTEAEVEAAFKTLGERYGIYYIWF